MRCNEVRPLLDVLCDGALDAKDSALVLDHLKTCVACQSEWDSLEKLRANFRAEREFTAIPDGLMGRISGALKAEDRRQQPQFFKRYSFVFPMVAIAASFAVIGFMVVPTLNREVTPPGNAQLAASETGFVDGSAFAEKLVDDVTANASAESVDKSELSKKLGYELKYLRLPHWQMKNSAVYTANSKLRIAKFDFSKKDLLTDGSLCCYQAPPGTINTTSSVAEDIGGKSVKLGSRGKLQFALWTQNGRDYLFVTALPQSALREIIKET